MPSCIALFAVSCYRNAGMAPHNKKVTFVLPAPLLQELRSIVALGQAESASAFVRDALETRLRAVREERLGLEFEAAARDPDFLADIEHADLEFRHADEEVSELIP